MTAGPGIREQSATGSWRASMAVTLKFPLKEAYGEVNVLPSKTAAFHADPAAWVFGEAGKRGKDGRWLDTHAPGWSVAFRSLGPRQVPVPGSSDKATLLGFRIEIVFADDAHRQAWRQRANGNVAPFPADRIRERKINAEDPAEICTQCGHATEPGKQKDSVLSGRFKVTYETEARSCRNCRIVYIRMDTWFDRIADGLDMLRKFDPDPEGPLVQVDASSSEAAEDVLERVRTKAQAVTGTR